MVIAGESLKKSADRFYDAIDPRNSRTDVLEDYYDLQVGPSYSRPLNLDPTTVGGNFNMVPKGKILVTPEYASGDKVFRDIIEITAADYYKIRTVGLECYVMVQSKNEDIGDKVFKINNLLSSEEPIDKAPYAEINSSLNTDTAIEVTSGTASSTVENRLVDAGQSFEDWVQPGYTVYNDTDGTSALVVNVIDDDSLLLDDDIMEIGETYRVVGNQTSEIGVIAIEGLNNTTDISEYRVDIRDNGATTTAVVWDVDNVIIKVQTKDIEDQIAEVVNAVHSGTAWATLVDKGGLKRKVPIFGNDNPSDPIGGQAIEMDDLPGFLFYEEANSRYVEPAGLAWKWYPGLPTLTVGTIGNIAHGEYVPDVGKMRYMIVTEGDLSYLGDDPFTIYLTTARSYDIDKFIISIPTLQTFLTSAKDPEYNYEHDYTINNHILEFKTDIYAVGAVADGDYLYHPKTPIIEHMLFDLYGNTVGISDWTKFNYDNISGKTAINALMESLQNSSERSHYNKALNLYYGLPVAPDDCEVIGLYESYGYEITDISTNQVTLQLKTYPISESLSELVQRGGRFLVEGKKEVKISSIVSRTTGVIIVDDASELAVGDKMHVKLRNRYSIKSIFQEEYSSPTDPPMVDIYSFEGPGAIAHVVDVVNATSSSLRYPEMIIHGTKDVVDNEGIYHITSAANIAMTEYEVVRLSLYKKGENEEPLYNDYIDATYSNVGEGYVHIPWPTHKFLYLLVNGEYYFKAYLDAPVDTIFDSGDKLTKHQVISRSVSTLTKTMFPDWNQFDAFRKFSGLNYQSDTLELIKTVVGSKFGDYFPSRYREIQ